MIELKAPIFPESISHGILLQWNKYEGDYIHEGDILVEIETDKIVLEVPSTSDGILKKILKLSGDMVMSNEIIANIEITSVKNNFDKLKSKELKVNKHLPPSMRKTLNLNKSDSIINTTNNLKKNDKLKPNDNQQSPYLIDKFYNFDKNLINKDSKYEKRVKMTSLRKTIANRLVQAQHTNAILTTFNEIDMTQIINLRNKYQDAFIKKHNTKLSFMSFFIKASTEALIRFPDVNASVDGDEIIYHNYFDISIAVNTDRGLVVPVLKDTNLKSLINLEYDIIDKVNKAREGKLNLEEIQGGTFTISNGGVYGSMLSTPIINPPQSAILGMHNIVERPIVIKGQIKIRPIMYLALSYDHRIIDGSTSVKFLKTIKELIEDPNRIILQI